jgi:hypothetical protein
MKKIMTLLSITLLFSALTSVIAQDNEGDDRKQIREAAAQELKDFRTENKSGNTAKPTNSKAVVLTAADVGEPDSFGKNVKFLGTATSGVILIYHSCDPVVLAAEDVVLGPDDRCMDVSNPAVTTTATFNDVGRIKIPAKSADNVIYFIANNFLYSFMNNSNTLVSSGRISYTPTVTIESEALLDPLAIDPTTGLPMNGSFTTGIGGGKTIVKTMQPNAIETNIERYSTAATRGFARGYFADLGLPTSVINKIYTKPMTIKLNIRVSTRYVEDGQAAFSMRFMGN